MTFAYKGKDRWIPNGTETIQVDFQANGAVKVYFIKEYAKRKPIFFGCVDMKYYDTKEEFEGDWEKLED